MSDVTSSSGISSGHTLVMEAEDYNGEDVETVYDDSYSNGTGISCSVVDNVIFEKSFNAGDLNGLYALKAFFNGIGTTQGVYSTLGFFDIYEDDELVTYDSNDTVNGRIPIIYFDNNDIVRGNMVYLWFNPRKAYTIIIKTPETFTHATGIILDFIQLTSIHSGGVYENYSTWFDGSEEYIEMQDSGVAEVTGTGAVYAQVTVYPNFVFEDIVFAEGIVENTTGLYNATPYNITGSSFGLAVRTTNDSAISTSTTVVVRWFCKGTVKLPAVRQMATI
jgi:hypothetical protein